MCIYVLTKFQMRQNRQNAESHLGVLHLLIQLIMYFVKGKGKMYQFSIISDFSTRFHMKLTPKK